MEIKTKYNIGDKVWVMNNDDEPTEFIIANIEIRKHNSLRPVLIFYSDGTEDVIGYWEERVFPTKEELLKSL